MDCRKKGLEKDAGSRSNVWANRGSAAAICWLLGVRGSAPEFIQFFSVSFPNPIIHAIYAVEVVWPDTLFHVLYPMQSAGYGSVMAARKPTLPYRIVRGT